MKTSTRLSACVFAFAVTGPATATRQADYALLKHQSVVFTCAAQGESYSLPIFLGFIGVSEPTSEADREEVRRIYEQSFIKSDWAVCVRRMKWVSNGLCGAIATALAAPEHDIGPALDAYRIDLSSLKHVDDYFEGARAPQPNRVACPGG